VLTRCFNIIKLYQAQHAKRGGGYKPRQALGHQAQVLRVKAIHVFAGGNGHRYLVWVDVRRQWQLHNETIYGGVLVYGFYAAEYLCLRGRVWVAHQRALVANLGTTANFVGYVGLAGAVVAHQHGHQMGHAFACFL
jgi:hypothetical protein